MPFDLIDFPLSPRTLEAAAKAKAEGIVEGKAEGEVNGQARMLAVLLRMRFGPDSRIGPIAHRLATDDPEDVLALLDATTSLDGLEC